MGRQAREAAAVRAAAHLSYCAETGEFTWKISPGGQARIGKIAGTFDVEGYRQIRFDGIGIRAHRLAWFMFHGVMPAHEIDHIDGDRANNAIANLRECRTFENNQNKPIIKTNTSGIPGVHFCKHAGKWRARIMILGKRTCLGSFESMEVAGEAYKDAKRQLHHFNPETRA